MALIRYLDEIDKRVERLSLSEMTRFELKALSTYIRTQALCDLDRRDKQEQLTEAARAFVRALYQASLQASLQQPQGFWETLERFAAKPLEIKLRPRSTAPVGSEKWDAKDLFQHLLSACEKLPDFAERAACLSSLKHLLSETAKVRVHRNAKANKEIWRTRVYPFIQKQNLMSPFRQNQVLKGRLEFFLKGHF